MPATPTTPSPGRPASPTPRPWGSCLTSPSQSRPPWWSAKAPTSTPRKSKRRTPWPAPSCSRWASRGPSSTSNCSPKRFTTSRSAPTSAPRPSSPTKSRTPRASSLNCVGWLLPTSPSPPPTPTSRWSIGAPWTAAAGSASWVPRTCPTPTPPLSTAARRRASSPWRPTRKRCAPGCRRTSSASAASTASTRGCSCSAASLTWTAPIRRFPGRSSCPPIRWSTSAPSTISAVGHSP